MGPVFSIAFLVPLIVGLTAATGTGAGNAASLAVLIAAIGVTGLGWIVAEYTRKIQAAGSLYDYVTDGLGGRVGTAAGWLYYVGMLALGAGILPMIGGTIHDTIVSEFSRAPFGYLVWDLILLVLVGTIIYLGVALSTRVQLTLAMISVSVVLVFSIYVIVKSGGVHHLGTGFSVSSSPTHWKGVFFGVLYGEHWVCEECSSSHQRDDNAAINLARWASLGSVGAPVKRGAEHQTESHSAAGEDTRKGSPTSVERNNSVRSAA